MPECAFAVGRIAQRVGHEAHSAQLRLRRACCHEVIDPIQQQRACAGEHPVGKTLGERVADEKRVDAFEEEVFRFITKRPIEPFLTLGGHSPNSIPCASGKPPE